MLRGDPSGADKVKVPRLGHLHPAGRGGAGLRDQARGEVYEELQTRYLAAGGLKKRTSPSSGAEQTSRMLKAIAKHLLIPAERHRYNVDRRGNAPEELRALRR